MIFVSDHKTKVNVIIVVNNPDGLLPPEGLTILGASGDHLLLDCGKLRLRVGDEVRFGVNYSALVRAMTSPFVEKKMIRGKPFTQHRK